MHCYGTEFGFQIQADQRSLIRKVGLGDRSEDIYSWYVEPPDGVQFEGRTLEYLWDVCKEFDGLVWYIHTKGASHPQHSQGSQRNFRRLLEGIVIEQWQHCIDVFSLNQDMDCYGAFLPTDDRYFYPGNFWWARSSHIRRLPNPCEWANKLCGRTGENVRYGYEDWVTLSVPNVKALAYGPWKP